MSRNHFNVIKPTIKDIIEYSESSSTAINADILIYVANKYIGYDLKLLNKLDDILASDIELYPHWYLFSVGNVKVRDTTGNYYLSGHYILISLEFIFNEPVLWYYTSQELNEKSKQELNEFHKKYNVRILPEVENVSQSVFNLIGEANSECGLFCLLFLQTQKRPSDIFVKSQFKKLKSLGKIQTKKTTKQIMRKDLKLNPNLILNNDKILLSNPIVKKTLQLQKRFG